MRYKTISLSVVASFLIGNLVSAQANTPTSTELPVNSIIAYFAADGTPLPTREGSKYYRYFKDIVSGCYLVQDFYSDNDQKQIDPICFTDPSELQSWFPQSLQGPLIFWDIDGNKTQEGYSNQDGGNSGIWKSWEGSDTPNTYELINGELIVSYFDAEGNRQPTPSAGGTFRTLIEQEPDTGRYIVADYFTDNRMKQMDPVLIERADLLQWDIQSREGNYTYYNDEGDLLTTEIYVDGKLDGPVTNWYPGIYPAQKKDELNFEDGRQQGLYVSWYPNGYPKIRMQITEDEIESLQCWNDAFEPLAEESCSYLFDDSAETDTDYNNQSYEEPVENNNPIEIIIPSEEITPDAAIEIEALDEIDESNNATVIFPNEPTEQEDAIEASEDAFEEYEDIPETEGQKILRSINNILNAL